MNDKARDLLVQAYLAGVPQIQKTLKTDEGVCALGVLYDHLVSLGICIWQRKFDNFYYDICLPSGSNVGDMSLMKEHFGIEEREVYKISSLNDSAAKPTFLDIARKVGIKEEVIPNGPGQADQGTGS